MWYTLNEIVSPLTLKRLQPPLKRVYFPIMLSYSFQERECVNLQRPGVWSSEPGLLQGLALHLQQNPRCSSLLLMRAGGMLSGPSLLSLFSLSYIPPTLAVRQAVLSISSYFILQPVINFKLFPSHLQWCQAIQEIQDAHQLPNVHLLSFHSSRSVQRESGRVPSRPRKHAGSSEHISGSFDSISCTIEL